MEIQERLLTFITRTNWFLFFIGSLLGGFVASPEFTRGIIFGGLIVTVNFHLLHRTLNKSFTPPNTTSHNVVLAKYYMRFVVSGIILFVLVSQHVVEPLGLILGLSVVVISIILATMIELKKIIFKEAV